MPIRIALEHITDEISLDECHAQLHQSGFNPNDQESFLEVAPILKRLNNNRMFLSETLCSELELHCRNQMTNNYTPQVIMLRPAEKGVSFFIRANIWLSLQEPLLATSGQQSFFYGVPHDHNFNFLTSGYLGKGYQSDYYEYEYHEVIGYPGEQVDLKFVERSCLSEGEVMMYRAYRDVHNQFPAEDLSVSLNIMPATPFAHLKPQYLFDRACRTVQHTTATSDSSIEPVLHLAAEIGGERCAEIMDFMASKSNIEQDRFRAIKAMASARKTGEEKIAVLETYGLNSSSRLIQELTRNFLEKSGLLQLAH